METNTEVLNFILGMKINQLRLEKSYSLKQLSQASGLSLSYISEIEKGKKYPKPDKLFKLAQALDTSYDELVSLKIEESNNPVASILNSPFLNDLPLKELGVSISDIFEMANNTPSKASAFVQTLLEIGRNYDMQVEHFLLASLRSYQKMHSNYFPKLEAKAKKFLEVEVKKNEITPSFLEQTLLNDYDVLVTYQDLSLHPELQSLRSIWVDGKNQKIIINKKLNKSQKVFELGKEIYYRTNSIKLRPKSSTWMQVKSFEQVLNNFKASYFAGALLLPEAPLVKTIKEFLRSKFWDSNKFKNIIASYSTTPEMFQYRLSQLLPHFFNLKQMHYMRVQNVPGEKRFHMTKELNTTHVFVPKGVGRHEHHCRRWVSIQLLKKLAKKQKAGKNPELLVSAQRSDFGGQEGTFFNIAIARPLSIDQNKNSCMTLGFRIDDEFKNKHAFWNDDNVPVVRVNETCERCPLSAQECSQRVASPSILNKQREIEEKTESLRQFIEEAKE
jgi:transcriptional regulator with XRE-family HTH domain